MRMLSVPKELLHRMLNLSEECLRERDRLEDAMNHWARLAGERYLENVRLQALLDIANARACKCNKPIEYHGGVAVAWGEPAADAKG